jgi:Flp pilus assembly pilin Flp
MRFNALHQQGKHRQGKHRQGGAAAVEFALVAVLLIVLLMGIAELGRFIYLFNTVQEVTRRAAREAVVSCTDGNTQTGIKSRAVLGAGTSNVSLPAGEEVTDARVVIDYLDKNLASIAYSIACPSPYNGNILKCEADASDCVRFVRVRMCDYKNRDQCDPVKYVPMIGLFVPSGLANMGKINLGVDIPGSTVIMPAESLGYTFTL